MDVKSYRIDIYELVGGGIDELLAVSPDMFSSALLARMRAERMCYRSSVGGWLPLRVVGKASIEQLARCLVPKLGTDAFYELY